MKKIGYILLALLLVGLIAYLRWNPKSFETCVESYKGSSSAQRSSEAFHICRSKYPKLPRLHNKRSSKLDCIDSDQTEIVYEIEVGTSFIKVDKSKLEVPIKTWNENFLAVQGRLHDKDGNPVVVNGRVDALDGSGFLLVSYEDPTKEKFKYAFRCVESD